MRFASNEENQKKPQTEAPRFPDRSDVNLKSKQPFGGYPDFDECEDAPPSEFSRKKNESPPHFAKESA